MRVKNYKTSNLAEYNNCIIKVGSDYYRINVAKASNSQRIEGSTKYGEAIFDIINSAYINNGANHSSTYQNTYSVIYNMTIPTWNVTATKVSTDAAFWTIPSTRTVSDQIYDIFAIPYGAISFGGMFTTNAALGLEVANNIATTLTSSACYDIQLLPYCPVPNFSGTMYNYTQSEQDKNWSYIMNGQDNPIGIIF